MLKNIKGLRVKISGNLQLTLNHCVVKMHLNLEHDYAGLQNPKQIRNCT